MVRLSDTFRKCWWIYWSIYCRIWRHLDTCPSEATRSAHPRCCLNVVDISSFKQCYICGFWLSWFSHGFDQSLYKRFSTDLMREWRNCLCLLSIICCWVPSTRFCLCMWNIGRVYFYLLLIAIGAPFVVIRKPQLSQLKQHNYLRQFSCITLRCCSILKISLSPSVKMRFHR